MKKRFFVAVWKPSIGTHGWTTWSGPGRAIVRAKSEDEAREKIRPLLPPENPEVKKVLLAQDNRIEYYNIKIREVAEKDDVIILNDAW